MDALREWTSWAKGSLAGNPYWAWAAAAGTALAVFVALLAARRFAAGRIRTWAERSQAGLPRILAGLVGRTWGATLLCAGVYAGTMFLRLPPRVGSAVGSALVVLALIQGGLWAGALLRGWLDTLSRTSPDAARSTAVLILGFAGRLVLWTVVLLLSLENLGVDVTALVAGLGVGGIAVALAVQNVLGDLLSSVAIALDKPFEVGDFIIVDDCLGVVERIGLKTTRVRSLFGEQIVFSNSDLLGSRIKNYKRMKERRIVFSIGVTYQTKAAQLEAIPGMIRETIQALPDLRFDRAHFQKYGDFALIFEVVYYVGNPDYNLYMDRQQAINLEIFKRFEKEGIEFAYPTQTVFLGKPAGVA